MDPIQSTDIHIINKEPYGKTLITYLINVMKVMKVVRGLSGTSYLTSSECPDSRASQCRGYDTMNKPVGGIKPMEKD